MEGKIPSHIGIILDGNGRWAKKRLMPRSFGHTQGAKNIENICSAAYSLGIKYLTVYAFSTENWKRSDEEVNALMKLFNKYLINYRKKAVDENMRVSIIGDRSKLTPKMIENIEILEKDTKDNTGLHFQIAINYGGRDEVIRAIKKFVKNGGNIDNLHEKDITDNLDTSFIPDPDLIIRTSGELRISNFLLWQCAYSEFYFTDVLWPDFDKNELKKAINYYADRNRRYGG